MSALTRLFVSPFHQRAIDEVNNLSFPVRNPRNSHNKSILRLVSTAAEMLLLEARQLSTQSTSCLTSAVPHLCCLMIAPYLSIFEKSCLNFHNWILNVWILNISGKRRFFREGSSLPWWGLTAGPHSRSWLAPGLGPVCNVNISSDGDNTLQQLILHISSPIRQIILGLWEYFPCIFVPVNKFSSS